MQGFKLSADLVNSTTEASAELPAHIKASAALARKFEKRRWAIAD